MGPEQHGENDNLLVDSASEILEQNADQEEDLLTVRSQSATEQRISDQESVELEEKKENVVIEVKPLSDVPVSPNNFIDIPDKGEDDEA